ncbi:unnamed protein product [Adineta ricciae]|uniref:Uncharacterized protein n=1 Tax=Adineta ricciae TaxID=249248 RepID=A0A816EVR4_ADIRI|nr:unnamed protein product [Adineta ricciae]CAF1650995.1 unnamed protein product [Adineta ricciae]
MRASTFGVIIGELVFTSHFATSNHDEKPFFIYEPIPIPFNHQQKRVRLSQMPAYVAIQLDSRQFVRWSPEEAEPCCFQVMTSCRVNPVIRKDLEDMCIYQVLISTPLKSCRIEPYLEPIFVRKVGNFWAISMNSSTTCHRATPLDSDNYKIMNNNAITLPPTSLLSAKDGAALSCDYFYLHGLPIQSHSRLVLYQNLTVNAVEEEVIDLHSFIHNNTQWEKQPYIPSHMQSIIDLITNTTTPSEILFWGQFKTHSMLTFGIVLIALLILAVLFLIGYIRFKHTKQSKVKITIPSFKTLEQQELALPK